jgi:hypothetical protein
MNTTARPEEEEENDEMRRTTTTLLKSRFYDDFDILQELGKGSFGVVYQVLSRLDGVRAACVCVCG